MTTIAYKNNQIAYDSQATRGDTIVNVEFDKKIEAEGYKFFFSGSTTQFDTLIELFFNGHKTTKIDATAAFVITPENEVLIAAFDDDGTVISDQVVNGEIYAIGSGSLFAIGAMDSGLSAYDAVCIAAKRDPYTGGTIKTYTIG